MRSKKIKIVFTIVLAVLCTLFVANMVFAGETDNFDFTRFDDDNTIEVDNATKSAMGTAIQVMRVVATGTSIIMLSYIGIKYMMAAPNEKAEFKRSAAIFVFGAVLVFAAGNILAIINSFVLTNIK